MMQSKRFSLVILILLLSLGCNFSEIGKTTNGAEINKTATMEGFNASPTAGGVIDALSGPGDHSTKTSGVQATATLNPTLSKLEVVFLKNGDLWYWTPSETRRLTTTGNVFQPRLSPDGYWVAFLRPVGNFQVELWAIDVQGKNERILVSVDNLNIIGGGARDPNSLAIAPYDYEWVPDSHVLAFNTQQILPGPGLFLLDDFHLVDADSQKLSMVLLAGWGGRFKISPDASKIALSTPTRVALANLDGSDFWEAMHYKPVTTYSDYRYYAQPVWKSDSSGIWVAIPPEDPLTDPVDSTNLYEIMLTERAARLVNQIRAVSVLETPIAYSPDAKYLVYLQESGDPQKHLRELYIAKPDGSGAWMYQRDYLLKFVTWSVDARHFVYIVGENQSVWLGDIQAPAKEILTGITPLAQIRWIDAENFLFTRVNYDKVDLFLGNLESPARLIAEQIDPPLIFDYFLGD